MSLKAVEMCQRFSELVQAVREDHRKENALVGGGHDFIHALMTAQYCLKIADEPLASLAWIAAICHNTDRIFPEWSDGLAVKVWNYLDCASIPDSAKRFIVEAVMNHSQRPSLEDNPVTVILMDADKLANLGSLLIIRSAQHQPAIPAINLRYFSQYPPNCSYRNPGSIYRDICSSLEWEGEFERDGEKHPWIRTKKARELAQPLFKETRDFFNGLVNQFTDTGLLPYPFLEDFE